MRYIPSSPATIHALKAQAKKLKRDGKGCHSAMLDLVAVAAGYDDWTHVFRCGEAFENFVGPVQKHLCPLQFEPMSVDRSEDYSYSIAFPLCIGERGPRQAAAARSAGVRLSIDGQYVLFDGFPPFDEGILVADDYSVTDANY